ncbi:hypothetical protein CKO25_00025 [Thiocapsa imhoffii]|uniref:HNH endonuclease n=1 Tax=Thiocapsa imhoffii TaxID=382777 RepID=A0A9X0WE38_9GAMM|nr:hypothetical protein [Thiocapsa imhoffii]MBK1643066.1 hypothetical protein [Thiocapsa imhoffii]
MIRVTPAPEPPDFDAKVRQPGLRAIAEMTGQVPAYPRRSGKAFKQRTRQEVQSDGTSISVSIDRPEDLPASEIEPYWTNAIADLMQAYDEVCAYSCFRIHPVTGAASVDHMAPKSRAWDRVYEWDNYRLAAARLNARKNAFGDVLDPFEVQNGWFELELVGFQIIPAHGLTKDICKQVQNTIDRLRLNDFRSSREEDAVIYWERHISFARLMRESPFVAMELRRQGRLRDGDA